MSKTTANQKQKEAIEHPLAPLMILAGAGTGKTFTLESRIIFMIKNHSVDPKHILAITYTEKAAKELKSRIINQVGKIGDNITIKTFHSFCYKILQDYGKHVSSQLLDQSEAIHIFLERFDELGPFKSNEFPMDPQKAIISSFIPFFNRMRDELINPLKKSIPTSELIDDEIKAQLADLKRIYPLFQEWKKKMNVIDYGDMILSCYNLLKSNNQVLNLVQDKFRNIIIDEFQDNNYALNEIINLISDKRKQITVVGDDDQVIYSFRGANMYNIKAFQNKYKFHNSFKYISLEKNYRSSQSILNLANSTISNNVDRMEKNLEAEQSYENIKPIRFWGEKEDQLNFLVKEIKYLKEDSISLNNIAVLCRTHNQCSIIADVLQKSGISTQPRFSSFFQIKEIRDIISWSQVVANGLYKETGFYRIIEQNCGYMTANKIYNYCNKKKPTSYSNLIENDKLLLNKYPKLLEIVSLVKALRRSLAKRSASEVIWEIVTRINLLTEKSKKYTLDDHFVLLNVGNLLKRSQDFTKRNQIKSSLSSFNIYIESIMNTGGLPSILPTNLKKRNGVIVNTIHGVKGGEFPIVFLPFLRSASFPLNFRKEKVISKPPDQWLKYSQSTDLTSKEHHMQEERRLFYVAITRAKEKLYLLVPKKATSKLVKELPDHLLEDHTMNTEEDLSINTYSNLRVKYENLLQNALTMEMYDEVINLTQALSKIKDYENKLKITWGEEEWEITLKNELRAKFQPEIPETLNLSASAIETYQSCPLKFRFGRIDGIPQNAKKPQLIFGNIIHLVLQRFHEPNKEISKERILRLLDEEWKKDDFDYSVREEKFKEQGIEILIDYVENIKDNIPNVIRTEEQFNFSLGSITIRGAIDRIDKIGEGVEIIDYKTSKTSSAAKSNLQLAIYSMYLEQLEDPLLGGIPFKSSLYFLRDKEKPIRDHSFTADQIANSKEEIISVAAGIRNKEFKPKTGKHCDWCDYKALACPAWEKNNS